MGSAEWIVTLSEVGSEEWVVNRDVKSSGKCPVGSGEHRVANRQWRTRKEECRVPSAQGLKFAESMLLVVPPHYPLLTCPAFPTHYPLFTTHFSLESEVHPC